MSQTFKTVCLIFVCFLSFVATGCVETSMMYHGNSPSSAMNVISLQKGGPQSETWKTFDITIDYQYIHNAEVLEISGHAVLNDHYQMNYNSVRRLDIFLFFLDDNSRILKTAKLTRSMTGEVNEIMTFTQQLTVPAQAKNLSFGYDGRTVGAYGDSDSFYELPLKKN